MESLRQHSREMEEEKDHTEYFRSDSGVSTESIHNQSYQETNAKLMEVEMQLQEKFMSSHKELQEAKQKLEELRLLRFEEKSVLKQEIKHLHEKYGEEERNSSKLERQLKKYSADKMALDERVQDLEREQSIGAQINLIQEQEVARLQMKLKDEELQRQEQSRQLEISRQTILDKDQLHLKQISETLMSKEKVAQLEETSNYYKNNAEDKQHKIVEVERYNVKLQEEVTSLKKQFNEMKLDNDKVSMDLRHAHAKVAQLSETSGTAQKHVLELQNNLEKQMARCESLEVEAEEEHKNQLHLQQELNTTKDKCAHTERLFHQTQRENEQQIVELQKINERIPSLEEQIRSWELKNDQCEFFLNELRNVIVKNIRKEDEHNEANELKLSKTSFKQLSPRNSFAPLKGKLDNHVTIEELEDYFNQSDIAMRSLQEQIMTLSQQVDREQSMMADLSTTIGSLRSELGRAQTSLTSNVKVKDTIQEQFQQSNQTIQLQEKSIEKKNEEINILRETIEEYKNQVELLKSDVASLNSEIMQNACAHKEESLQLQLIVDGVQKDVDNEREEKKGAEMKFEEEVKTFKEHIDNQDNEITDLKGEMENLIEDNKNLAQRLMHLETYSDKLSDMLDKNQSADDKARDKFTKEIKEYKQLVTEKDEEVGELTRKVDELSASVHEKNEYQDQIDMKMKNLATSLQSLEEESKLTLREKVELEDKLSNVSNAHLNAEKTLAENTEENHSLDKRCSEQLNLMEELHDRINFVENENSSLKQSVTTLERSLRLKESVIADLSRRAGETTESFTNLKSSVQKAETDKRHYENQMNIFRHEKQMLEKNIREQEEEKSYMRDQVTNLQRLLARAEDEKEASLGNIAHHQNHAEAIRSIKEKTALKDLEGQIQSLRVELNLERQRRERLETRYTTRDDQVHQLRTTFDQSLTTISKDTKNIKSIIGKSLQKIDRIKNNEDSDIENTDSSLMETTNNLKLNKYLASPSHRTKSVESLGPTYTTPSSTPRKIKYGGDTKGSPVTTPRMTRTLSTPGKALAFVQETPVRDDATGYRSIKR